MKIQPKIPIALAIVILFAVIVAVLMLVVGAAVNHAAIESERSSRDGSVAVVDDSNASQGKSLVFSSGGGSLPNLESLRNPGGLFQYNSHENLSSSQVNALGPGGVYGAFHNPEFTFQTAPSFPHIYGNFRLQCAVSHFGYDDPIIKPGQPGKSHLHMFWGNTKVDAFTGFNTSNPANNLLERGGSSCAGGVLNRSAYWMPAMISGHGSNRKIVMPNEILLYYKSQRPGEVQPLPQGIQLLIGNVNPGGSVNDSIPSATEGLHWGCNDGSQARSIRTTIPGTNGSAQCPANHKIQATIQFPQCIATDNGRADGNPVLTSPDFISHTKSVLQSAPCPSSHPYRVPQISYLVKWDNPAGSGEANWRLSSDRDFDKTFVPNPGGSLHGDWLGGWHEQTIQAWIEGCFLTHRGTPGLGNLTGRSCSLGQTGTNRARGNGTEAALRRIPGTNMDSQQLLYAGQQYFDDPAPFYQP